MHIVIVGVNGVRAFRLGYSYNLPVELNLRLRYIGIGCINAVAAPLDRITQGERSFDRRFLIEGRDPESSLAIEGIEIRLHCRARMNENFGKHGRRYNNLLFIGRQRSDEILNALGRFLDGNAGQGIGRSLGVGIKNKKQDRSIENNH